MAAALSAWPERIESVTPIGGGWNSRTWLVRTFAGPYVAKLVDAQDAGALAGSLRVAEFAAARGLACGPPARARDGNLTAAVPGGELALLRYMPGGPPDVSNPAQVRRAGRLLARAHRILQEYPATDDSRDRWPWEWVPRCFDTIAMPAEVGDAARRAWRDAVQTAREYRLPVGLIHADPGPDAFRLHPTDPDQDALIDWATTLRGPRLYDLACFAVTTDAAGPSAAQWFADGYREVTPQISAQLEHLPCFIRARWMANAIYFADRIARGIRRGSQSPTANQDGLDDALRGMTGAAGG